MRKIVCMIAIAAMILVPALSLAQTMTAKVLAAQWEMKGYPNDVGSVYVDSETEKLVFTLTDNTEARQQELLALVSDPDQVDFGDATYSYNELFLVQEEIANEMAAQGMRGPIYGVGIGWTSVNGTVLGFGESGKESRVVVTLDEDAYKEYAAKYKEAYGDKVFVEYGGEASVVAADTFSGGGPALIVGVAVIFLLGGYQKYRLNKRREQQKQ